MMCLIELIANNSECGRSDYFSKDGVGKFAEFMMRRGRSEETVERELSCGFFAADSSYLSMDDDFPLTREYTSDGRREAAISKVFALCSKWSGSDKECFIRELQRNLG